MTISSHPWLSATAVAALLVASPAAAATCNMDHYEMKFVALYIQVGNQPPIRCSSKYMFQEIGNTVICGASKVITRAGRSYITGKAWSTTTFTDSYGNAYSGERDVILPRKHPLTSVGKTPSKNGVILEDVCPTEEPNRYIVEAFRIPRQTEPIYKITHYKWVSIQEPLPNFK